MAQGLLQDLQVYAEDVVQRHVPGVSIAIWADGTSHRAAAGVLNVETHVEATPDSIFQIGSISKVFTATLVMLLVEAGKLDLDEPIQRYLPGFQVADIEVSKAVTLRHLLAHTSGLVSDSSLTYEDEIEDDTISRYVDRCFLLPQVHKNLGGRFSYSNAAYVIAGRVVEIVAAMPWRRAVERLIFAPLQMTHSIATPTDILKHRAAAGHIRMQAGGDAFALHPRCYLPLGMAPTGSVLTMSASDLLTFGLAHLNLGRANSGEPWLSKKSARQMRAPQIQLPAKGLLLENGWGVGWGLGDHHSFSHGGGTAGQQAFLELLPEIDAGYSFMVNGMSIGGASALAGMQRDILRELTGREPDTEPKPLASTLVDLPAFVGAYGITGHRYEVSLIEGSLHSRLLGSNTPSELCRLSYVGDNRFVSQTPTGEKMDTLQFLDLDEDGKPGFLFSGYRMQARLP